METALTNDGAPASVKYLDLQDSNFTNGGLTLSTNLSSLSNDWNYADTSNGSEFVGGTLLDDKDDGAADEIEATISGLAANTDYNLWLTMKITDDGNSNEKYDFDWGTASGSLTRVEISL